MVMTRRGESQKRILEHVKRRGPSTIPTMATELELSVETVRTHLKGLEIDGLVSRVGRQSKGPGRPEIVFGLTKAGHALFPSREGEVLRDLAVFLEAHGHEDLVRAFFDGELGNRRAEVLAGMQDLEGEERMAEAVRVLTGEGFMAEIEEDEGGRPLLRLCNCPLRELVSVTSAPCRAELRFVSALLDARLSRVSYMPSGDAACRYAVEALD